MGCLYGKTINRWMMTGGTPVSGTPHIITDLEILVVGVGGLENIVDPPFHRRGKASGPLGKWTSALTKLGQVAG